MLTLSFMGEIFMGKVRRVASLETFRTGLRGNLSEDVGYGKSAVKIRHPLACQRMCVIFTNRQNRLYESAGFAD